MLTAWQRLIRATLPFAQLRCSFRNSISSHKPFFVEIVVLGLKKLKLFHESPAQNTENTCVNLTRSTKQQKRIRECNAALDTRSSDGKRRKWPFTSLEPAHVKCEARDSKNCWIIVVSTSRISKDGVMVRQWYQFMALLVARSHSRNTDMCLVLLSSSGSNTVSSAPASSTFPSSS